MDTIPSLRALRTERGLAWISAHIGSHRPDNTIDINAVRATTLRHCVDTYSDDRTCNGVLNDLLTALPAIHDGDTRAQYAIRIQDRMAGRNA